MLIILLPNLIAHYIIIQMGACETSGLAESNTPIRCVAQCEQLGNADISQIVSERTFTSSNGLNIIGTMPYNPGGTYTPGTINQTVVPANSAVTTDVVIKGDSNLKASNIKNGVSIFGVTGTYNGNNNSDDSDNVTCTVTSTNVACKVYSPNGELLSTVVSDSQAFPAGSWIVATPNYSAVTSFTNGGGYNIVSIAKTICIKILTSNATFTYQGSGLSNV